MSKEPKQRDAVDIACASPVRTLGDKERVEISLLKLARVPASGATLLEHRPDIITNGWLSASIIHDLRNPVAAIYAGAETLLDIGPLPSEAKRIATNIHPAAECLRELLAELTSVVCGKRPTVEMCDIREIIAAAWDAASTAIGNKRVAIVLDIPKQIELPLQRSRMKRVFFTLITNALEAMPSGGEVRTKAEIAEKCLLVHLEDTGPGIPRQIRERLFEPFVTAGKLDGLGLGLALSRQTVRDHGGDIWIEPATGSFVVRLPLTGPACLDGLHCQLSH